MNKRMIALGFAGAVLLSSLLQSCTTEETFEETTEASVLTEAISESENMLRIAARGEASLFKIVGSTKTTATDYYANLIKKKLSESLGVDLETVLDYKAASEYEILIGATMREECAALTETLGDDEYAIECTESKLIIAYKGNYALMCAVDRLLTEFLNTESGAFEIPKDTKIKSKFTEEDTMIVSSIKQLRDPCVLVENGVYYVYGTNWVCYKNTSGSLAGEWEYLGVVAEKPAESDNNYWAPEVHKYGGAYYMFTTYHSSVTGHRGCTILKSDRPEGPFREITNGQITPHDWDSIDGTFYVDEEGQPWMVFVHEWTSTDDGIGRMAAAKLSDDLTHFISEPIELFRADDPSWSRAQVTDGCWMYRTEDGQLLMIWSNSDTGGYCVGIARSSNGKIDGEWTQDSELLYSKNMQMKYDGGHGMIFYDTDGQMYLSIHSPNKASGDRKETPVFIPIREENGTLVWDIYNK